MSKTYRFMGMICTLPFAKIFGYENEDYWLFIANFSDGTQIFNHYRKLEVQYSQALIGFVESCMQSYYEGE